MRFDKLIQIFKVLAIALALFFPVAVSAQALSTEASCRKLGFEGERRVSPGLLPSMVIRSMDPRMQCGVMFNRRKKSDIIKFDPKEDPKAQKFLDRVIKQGKSSTNKKIAEDYAKQREKNVERESKRQDPAKYYVSLIIDSSVDPNVFRSKLEELKRFGEKQVVSVGAVIVLGMEQRIRENVDSILTKLYSNRVSKNSNSSFDLSSIKPPNPDSVYESSLTGIEKTIYALKFRRKGSVNVKAVAREMNIDRLPVWIFYGNDEQIVFDGKLELTGLIDNFGELYYDKKLESSAPSASVIDKSSGRDFVYIVDRINPRLPNLGPELRIPSGKQGGRKEGLKRF